MILGSSFFHALWNLLVRRGAHPEAFLWWLNLVATLAYLPLGIWMALERGVPAAAWPYVIGTGLIHAFYFVFLGRAYERGDLGLVYPIARGTGPLLVPLMAVPLLGERITPLGGLGILLIVIGVVTLSAGGFGVAAARRLGLAFRNPGARYAVATGVTIALYSVNDKAAVGLMSPVLFGYMIFPLTGLIAAPYFWGTRRAAMVAVWRSNRRSIVLAGVVAPLTYITALTAFSLGPVSYLAPMREVSIVIASLLGMLLLGERRSPARLLSAGLTALGVILIGFAA